MKKKKKRQLPPEKGFDWRLTKTRRIFIHSQEVTGRSWDVLFIEAARNRACQTRASWHTRTVQKVWVQALPTHPHRKVYLGSHLNKKSHFLRLYTLHLTKRASKSKMETFISSQTQKISSAQLTLVGFISLEENIIKNYDTPGLSF